MSGALATALNVTSAAGNAFNLLTGQGPISLDDLVFQDYAVPERVQWGGQMQLVAHWFPGGGKVVDVMGYQDSDVSWSGILLGSNASSLARRLDQMRISGDQVTLVWGDNSRQVVVVRCDFVESYARINYTITCCVIPDDTGSDGVNPTALDQIKDDVNSALGFDLTGTLEAAADTLNTVNQALTPLIGAISPSAAAILNQYLGAATGTFTLLNAISDSSMSAVSSASDFIDGTSAMSQALSSTGAAANGYTAAGYAARAAANN